MDNTQTDDDILNDEAVDLEINLILTELVSKLPMALKLIEADFLKEFLEENIDTIAAGVHEEIYN